MYQKVRDSVEDGTKVMHTRYPSVAFLSIKPTYLREVVPAVRTGQQEWQSIHEINAGFLNVWRWTHWVVLGKAMNCPPSVGPEDPGVTRSAIAFILYQQEGKDEIITKVNR